MVGHLFCFVLFGITPGGGVVNRVCKSTYPCLFSAKSIDSPILLIIPETCKLTNASGKVNVNAIVTRNFVQIVNKATCLMTITQYHSSN